MDIKAAVDKVMENMIKDAREVNANRLSNSDAWDTAKEFLGYPGRMLSGSKTAPKDQTVVWNANICTVEHGKIWFGDFNVTRESDKLIDLAARLDTRIFVLREHDARFENELNPRFNEAVYSVDKYGGELHD